MTTLLATMMLLATVFVFSACSNDDTTPTPNNTPNSEISLNADVWRMMEGTRATTFDGTSDLQSLAHFYCAVYNAGTLTPYFTPGQVSYSESQWTFDSGKHYWPAEGSLDFFAYAPYGGVSYISDLTYAATPNLTFNCALPMTNAEQADNVLEEFVYDIKNGRNKSNSASGVTLSFQHPFARIKLQLSSTQETIRINTITLKSIKNNGSYSHTSGWTPSDPATNFVATLNGDCEANDDLGTFIMIPQSWAGEIEVNADWTVWGVNGTHTVTATVPTTWQPGYSYTYTFTITETDLIVDASKFTEQW
jgi:hypothetical protein